MVRSSTRGSKRSHSAAAAEDRSEVAIKKTKISAAVKKSPASPPQSKRATRSAKSTVNSPSKNEVAKKPVKKSPSKNEVAKKPVKKSPSKNEVAKKPVIKSPSKNEVARKPVKKSPPSSPQSKRVTRNAESKTKSPTKNEAKKKPSLRSKEKVSIVLNKLPTTSSPARETRTNKSSKPVKAQKLESDGDKQIVRKSETRSLQNNATNKKVDDLKSAKKTPVKPARQSLSTKNGLKASAKVEIAQKLSLRASGRLSTVPKKNYAHVRIYWTEVADAVPKTSIAKKKLLIKKALNKGNKAKNAKRPPPTKRTAKSNSLNQVQNKKNVKRRLHRKKTNSPTPKTVTPSKRRSTTVKRIQRQSAKRVPKSVKRQNGIVYSEADVQMARNTKLSVSLEKLQNFEDSDSVDIKNDDVAVKTQISGDNALANGNATENDEVDDKTEIKDDDAIEIDVAEKSTTEDVDAAVNGDADQNSIEDVDADQNVTGDVDAAVNGDTAPNATEDVDTGANTDAVPSTTKDVDANNIEKRGNVNNNNESVEIPDNGLAMEDGSEQSDVLENTDNSTKDSGHNLAAEGLERTQEAIKEKEKQEISKLEAKMVLKIDDSDEEGVVDLVENESICQNEQTKLGDDLKSKDVLVQEDSEDPNSSTSDVNAADLECDPIESVEDIVAKLHGSVSETLGLCETQYHKAKKSKKEKTTEVELKITYSKCHVKLDSDEEKQLKAITAKSDQVSALKTIEEVSDCSNEIETFSASLKAQVLRRHVLNPNFDENGEVSFSIVSYNVDGQKDHQDLINEIILLKPSILCLQNIDESYFKNSIECGLRLHNYKGVFTGLSDGGYGLAMFYHTSHFELIQNSGYKVNNLLNKEIQDMTISNLEKEQLLSFLESEFSQANIIKVKSKVNGKELTICSVNLASTNELIVGIQASTILSEVLREKCKDYIICGTFHLEEDSYLHQFLKGGSMNAEDLEEVKKKFPGDDVTKTDLLRSLLEGLQQNCKDLKSCYSTILGHELCFPQSDKKKAKNSIWFSNNGLQIRNVLDAIAKSPLTDDVLESHISLKSEFQFI